MAKKRKRTDAPAEAAGAEKPDDSAPARPERTLFGFKDLVPDAEPASAGAEAAVAPFRNREKVLITCSRRITYRYRHLMQDVLSLLPHAKKDSKVESKQSKGNALNELLELRSCSSCLFFECRKQKDLYLWMVKSPGGPSVKFLVNAVHTMEELKLTGNHLKGSRPLLTFSTNFDEQPHWKLVKEMITQIRALEKRQKAGKYAKKVKAKVRRKMHEMENTLEPDEFAELWKGE
uniref:Brix domain-containing protein n=1 Tax=Zea mays TaxID=4577 RepID=A0A804NSR7_MAIZE